MTVDMPELSKKQSFEFLARGAVAVTATRGLARRMTFSYAEFRLEKGDKVWETPDILPWEAWLSRMFYDSVCSPGVLKETVEPKLYLLDDSDERLVWERIISGSEAAERLLGVSKTARLACEAWRLCRQWKVDIGGGLQWSAPDPAVFAEWAKYFEQFCRDHGYMDRAGLASYLGRKAEQGFVMQPLKLILAGFDEYSPAQIELFAALSKRGTDVYCLERPKKAASARLIALPDDASEIRAAAAWARKSIENNPKASIGVVSSRLATDREAVQRVFTEVLHPDSVFSGQKPENRMFQISASPVLFEYPVVGAAAAILGLTCRQGAEVLEWSRFLRSPFIGGADTEYGSRALLDARIRDMGDLYYSISRLSFVAEKKTGGLSSFSDLKILSVILERLRARSLNMPVRQGTDQWAEQFSAILEDAGWPGERSLSESEYQAVSAHRQCLEEFSKTGYFTGPVSGNEALRIFFQKLSETYFQPEHPEVSVRIMGMLESAGEEFDALWIMGLHHENWPAPARPNPFLPADIQRESGLPHCSPARELSYAGLITNRLLESANEVVCSFGKTDGESVRLASPLVDHLEEYDDCKFQEAGYENCWQRIYRSGGIEWIQDVNGAPIAEGRDVAGGTGIMKSQALCPFQAYGRYRLGACKPESPEAGLNPRQRGTLVHDVLQLIWDRLKKNEVLEELSFREIEHYISEAVDRAMARMADKMPGTFTDRFTRLEKERLQSLVEEWIKEEQGRGPFSVAETESRMHLSIGGIGISAFADRIDLLDNGRLVLIDYKTGDVSPGEWFAERITEPQLPLYSLGMPRELLAGVFFGRVKKGGIGYTGISETEGVIPGCRGIMDDGRIAKDFESMEEVLAFWENKLANLADEIRTGYAPVLPVSRNKSCRYCDLSPVCRIWETSAEPAEEEKADNDISC